jgi:hypothetical protein
MKPFVTPKPTIITTITQTMKEASEAFNSGESNVIVLMRSTGGKILIEVGAHSAGDPDPATPNDIANLVNALPDLLEVLGTLLEEIEKSRN